MKQFLYLLPLLIVIGCSRPKTDPVAESVNAWIAEVNAPDTTDYAPDYYESRIDTICNNDRFLTLFYTYWGSNEGAAHGFYGYTGRSFRKTDGARMNWGDMFEHATEDGLIRIVDSETRYQHPETMFFDEVLDKDGRLPLPQSAPYIVGDTVICVYQQYEIASYADGVIETHVPLCTSVL